MFLPGLLATGSAPASAELAVAADWSRLAGLFTLEFCFGGAGVLCRDYCYRFGDVAERR